MLCDGAVFQRLFITPDSLPSSVLHGDHTQLIYYSSISRYVIL